MDSLDDLINAAVASIPKKQKAEPKRPPSLLNIESWKPGRGIALIHAESSTLLGNFIEHLHPSGARRLVRAEGPVAVSAAESVSGSWWLGEGRQPVARKEWHETKRLFVHLLLSGLKAHSPAVEIQVFLAYGGIERVELAETTLFASTMDDSLVELPAGCNVLEVLSLDSKVKIREECGA